jgi:hypothetical protein
LLKDLDAIKPWTQQRNTMLAGGTSFGGTSFGGTSSPEPQRINAEMVPERLRPAPPKRQRRE